MNFKIYLDDIRKPPYGWYLTMGVKETIELLKTNKIIELSLDHDLGNFDDTGYDVLLWIEKQVHMNNFKPPIMKVHSSNSSARIKMENAINNINKYYNLKHEYNIKLKS